MLIHELTCMDLYRVFKKSTAVPKHIEKRRSELESEGYQVGSR